MHTLIRKLVDSLLLRVSLGLLFVAMPVGVTASWMVAGYFDSTGEIALWKGFALVMLYLIPVGYIGSVINVYVIERWIIKNNALRSIRWIWIRLGLYLTGSMVVAFELNFVIQLSSLPLWPLAESSFFLMTMLPAALVVMLFTFAEHVVVQMREREAKLQGQIDELKIEIDLIKQNTQVAEIVDSDFFTNLQEEARQQRAKKPRK